MDWVSGFTTYLGLGEEIAEIFTGGDDVATLESFLENMFSNLFAEIKQVFNQDLTDAAAATAAGVAQMAQDFLAIDYVNAQRARESDAQLWTLLSTDSSGPSLQALSAQASTMTTWAQDYPKLGAQTVSLALTIYSLSVALRRERAKHAPDRQIRVAELSNMRTYARLAVSRLQPLLDSVSQARAAAISLLPAQPGSHTFLPPGHGSGPIRTFWWYVVTDGWNTTTPIPVLTVQELGPEPSPQLQSQIANARDLYVKIAQGGSASDMAQWQQQLTQQVTTGSYFQFQGPGAANLTPSAPGLQAQLESVAVQGSWLYKARTTLQSLTQLSLKGHACVFSETVVSVSQHPIDLSGMLRSGTLTPPLQFPSQNPPSAVVLSAAGRYAYIVHQPIPPGISPVFSSGTGAGAACLT
jgi:hypothetical protein